jgi:glycosyltransferase involved in cell wall biosynthesis
MRARRVLVITYYFPPRPVIGSTRWAAMSEWLRQLGYEVTVVTSRFGEAPAASEPGVVRTFDVGALGSARKLLGRKPLPSSGTAESVQQPTPPWFTDVLVPDEYLLVWGLAALMPIRRLIRERGIDCVITTGPPHSTHLLPLLLGRERFAWIVDLRDGWRFEPLRTWPTRGQQRLDAALERRVLRSADQVIGVTQPIAADAGNRLAAHAAYVPNGWDPAAGAAHSTPESQNGGVRLKHDRVNVVHTGTLSGTRGRDPRPVFEALRRLAVGAPDSARRLRLVLAGTLSAVEQRLLNELDLAGAVQHLGSLSKDRALALQREADVLLLLTSPTHVSDATGKFFEYLAAGRPILALASGNDAARIVAETGVGVTVHPLDVDGIARALQAAAEGTLAASHDPSGLARYSYPQLAAEVAELIELAVARRAQGDGHRAKSRSTAGGYLGEPSSGHLRDGM